MHAGAKRTLEARGRQDGGMPERTGEPATNGEREGRVKVSRMEIRVLDRQSFGRGGGVEVLVG